MGRKGLKGSDLEDPTMAVAHALLGELDVTVVVPPEQVAVIEELYIIATWSVLQWGG